MLATWGTPWPPHQLVLNKLCVQRLDFQHLKKCCMRCLLRYLSVWGCHSCHSPSRRGGNTASHRLASGRWGRMWKALLVSALKHPYLLPGTALPRPITALSTARAKLGRKCALKGLFPRHWDEFSSMRGPSATGESSMETENRFHCLIPFYRRLPQKAHW